MSSKTSESANRPRILVMDDEEAIRDISQTMLEKFGFEARLAQNGEEAVAIYKDAMDEGKQFNAVLLDLTVPGGMGGEEAAQKILAMDTRARIIVSSGNSGDTMMTEYDKHGIMGALPKPYRIGELKKAVESVLETPS